MLLKSQIRSDEPLCFIFQDHQRRTSDSSMDKNEAKEIPQKPFLRSQTKEMQVAASEG